MCNTFRQGIPLKKTVVFDRRIDFRDRIKSRSEAELKITLMRQGVSV